MKNWFNTLNDSLESEGLVEAFPVGINLNYGQVFRGCVNGLFFTITRDNNGLYERPIKYNSKMEDFYTISNL
jgi:hypothetical protein